MDCLGLYDMSPRQRRNLALESAIDSMIKGGNLLSHRAAYGLGVELREELRQLGYQIAKIPKPRSK